MSKLVLCDECKKVFYTDSRENKGVYVSMTADDPLYGYSSFHLCRKCFNAKFPWLTGVEQEECDSCDYFGGLMCDHVDENGKCLGWKPKEKT